MSNPGTASEHPNSPRCSESRASHRHSDGFATTPAAISHPSTMHKDLQSPCDAQASALDRAPHEIDAIPNFTASAASSLPHPIKDVPSVQQLLQQQEAKWFQRYRDQARKHQDDYWSQLLEYQKNFYQCSKEWHERCEKKNKEILERSVEISSLIVETSPPIFLLFLTDI